MPLAGALDIRPLLDGAPTTTLADESLRIEDVDILQAMFEIAPVDLEALVPPALNPTIPPVVSVLAYRARESVWGPFALVQARITARAGVRPRAFLLSAVCDNAAAAEALAGRWGFRTRPGTVTLRRFYDRVECRVSVGREHILEVAMIDPEPIMGHDIQYAPGMHLARVEDDGVLRPRLVQVDTEYVFRRADRGRVELSTFDAAAWGNDEVRPVGAVSASFTACEVTLTPVRYVCNPDLPAAEGTQKVGAG